MNKNEVFSELLSLVVARLYGGHPWPADRETVEALNRKLLQLGLIKQVPGEIDAVRDTALGEEQNLDLIMVFLGIWDECEVPGILEKYGLINEVEFELIFDFMCHPGYAHADRGALLYPFVRRAYRAYYNISPGLN